MSLQLTWAKIVAMAMADSSLGFMLLREFSRADAESSRMKGLARAPWLHRFDADRQADADRQDIAIATCLSA